jgi:hypothetical protein
MSRCVFCEFGVCCEFCEYSISIPSGTPPQRVRPHRTFPGLSTVHGLLRHRTQDRQIPARIRRQAQLLHRPRRRPAPTRSPRRPRGNPSAAARTTTLCATASAAPPHPWPSPPTPTTSCPQRSATNCRTPTGSPRPWTGPMRTRSAEDRCPAQQTRSLAGPLAPVAIGGGVSPGGRPAGCLIGDVHVHCGSGGFSDVRRGQIPVITVQGASRSAGIERKIYGGLTTSIPHGRCKDVALPDA